MARSGLDKHSKWNFRVGASDDALVRAASSQSGDTLSAFVRGAAVSEAERVLADRMVFELDQPAWAEFNELLDREPRVPDGLRDLFSKPSAFD